MLDGASGMKWNQNEKLKIKMGDYTYYITLHRSHYLKWI